MGAEATSLPLDEKAKYEQNDAGTSPGYEMSLELCCMIIGFTIGYFAGSRHWVRMRQTSTVPLTTSSI